MDTNPVDIALPLAIRRWQHLLLAGIMLPIGLGILGLAIYVALGGLFMEALSISIFAVLSLGLGGASLLQCLIWVHFVPEGIALTLGQYTLRRMPIEEVRLACRVQSRTKNSRVTRTLLSGYTLEGLTALREKQLLQSPYMRSNVPYRKRHPDWQRQFAAEYLHSKNRSMEFGYLKPRLLWLDHLPELDAILETMYPDRPIIREDFIEPQSISSTPWTDRDRLHFCRGQCKAAERPILGTLCMVFILSPLMPLLFPEALSAIVPAVLLSGIFLTLWLLGRDEYDVVHPEAEGIRLTRAGRPLAFLPADQIRVILRSQMSTLSFSHGLLVVTTLTPEEVVAREMERLSRTARGRRMLRSWQQLPGWEERLFVRSCLRLPTIENPQSRGILVMANAPGRADTLEELFPNAQPVTVDKLGAIQF